MPRLLPSAVLLVGLLVAAPAAHAGTLALGFDDSCHGDESCEKYQQGTFTAHAVYTGAPGEVNTVQAHVAGDGTVTVTDATAPVVVDATPPPPIVTGPASCQAVDEHTATCAVAMTARPISLRLADQDDRATIIGASGASLDGGDGADVLLGGTGPDVVVGGPGDDRLDGGPGTGDLLSYLDAPGGVVVDLAAGRVTGAAGADAVSGFETLFGSQDDDDLRGGPGADELLGAGGDDRVAGRAGDDVLGGGTGSDTLEGGSGDDAIRTDPTQGDDVSTLTFTPGDDVARGGPGRDRISDLAGGADRLSGGAGPDRLVGGPGPDVLSGGPGDDDLAGGTGADGLTGGSGRDRLAGGDGADRMSARDGRADAVACGLGRDLARLDRVDTATGCE